MANAQAKFDAHVGFSPAANLKGQEIRITDLDGPVNYAMSPSEQGAGYTFGLGLTKDMESGFFIRAELQYNYSKTTYQLREILPIGEGPFPMTFDDTHHSLVIPLSVGVKLGKVRILSGVDANAILARTQGLDQFESFQDNSSTLFMSWHAGLGLDLNRVGFEVRYTQDFQNYGQGYTVGEKDLDFYGNRNRWTVVAKYYITQ